MDRCFSGKWSSNFFASTAPNLLYYNIYFFNLHSAFLLVGLFVRKTSEELSGAIIDALSAFVQAVMDRAFSDPKENNYIAGQYIQLAFLLQLFLNIPLLLVWAIFTRQFVLWLRFSEDIAGIAAEYASIVVVAYIVQALSRTLTVTFHISGHEHFESVIDLVASAMQVITIASVVVVVEGVDLGEVAYIQGELLLDQYRVIC